MDYANDTDRLLSFLKGLRTVRFFEGGSVPQDALADILEVARWSGSAMKRQPWEFVVVRARRTLEELSTFEGHADHLRNASAGIVLVMAGEREEQETFDEGRVTERISLAAAAHGLGSAVGWFAGTGRGEAKRLLHIPPRRVVRTAVSLGYARTNLLRGRSVLSKGRKPLAGLAYEERYGNPLSL